MALVSECNATMMYWLPLRAHGWKRPVSTVKILLIGIVMMSTDCCGCVGVAIGGVCVLEVDLMC